MLYVKTRKAREKKTINLNEFIGDALEFSISNNIIIIAFVFSIKVRRSNNNGNVFCKYM